ncbi:MAG: hypothetical protein IT220_01120 [Flavobacteriaceae bacterium]|nr:hypothetical protein [Flavobacteriaceae bacterium]
MNKNITISMILFVILLFGCASKKTNQSIFKNRSFEKELNSYINYINKIDPENNYRFIFIDQANSTKFSIYTFNYLSYESSQGFLFINGRYIIFDKKISNNTLHEWLLSDLEDMKNLNCNKCTYEFIEDYTDPYESIYFSYISEQIIIDAVSSITNFNEFCKSMK